MAADQDHDLNTNYPPGYRFVPTDEELIRFYLANKVHYQSFPTQVIKDIHTDKFHSEPPHTLVQNMCSEGEWYFFIHQDDYFRGKVEHIRMVGKVGDELGYWRCFGKEFPICNSEGDIIGFKISWTYYSGSMPKKATWTLEKYRLSFECGTDDPEIEEWVLGRIIRGRKKDYTNNHF